MHVVMQRTGISISQQCLTGLMRQAGLRGTVRGCGVRTTIRGRNRPIVGDLAH
ncbi:hypothetical protein [Corynebacterium freiburgense]|uniref:hypothetical protein n=1 Tax=Corynebacterium freiburgense TaxID=556548 RepID=UPI000404E78A|nr:hypothetical protein [Corynebacterium freiburgense]